MTAKNAKEFMQPTLKAIHEAFAQEGGGMQYTQWLEVQLVNCQTRLIAAKECIADLAGDGDAVDGN